MEKKPFALIGVNANGYKSDRLKQAMETENLTWRSFADPWDVKADRFRGPIGDRWDHAGTPTLYILDHKGVIRYRSNSLLTPKAIDDALATLIKEAEDAGKKEPRPGARRVEWQTTAESAVYGLNARILVQNKVKLAK